MNEKEIESKSRQLIIDLLTDKVEVSNQEVFDHFKLMFNNFYGNLFTTFAPEGASLKDYCYAYNDDELLYASLQVPIHILKGVSFKEVIGLEEVDDFGGNFKQSLRRLAVRDEMWLQAYIEAKESGLEINRRDIFINLVKESKINPNLLFFYAYFSSLSRHFDMQLYCTDIVNLEDSFFHIKCNFASAVVALDKEELIRIISVSKCGVKYRQKVGSEEQINKLLRLEKPQRIIYLDVDSLDTELLRLSLGYVSCFNYEDILKAFVEYFIIQSGKFFDLENAIKIQKQSTIRARFNFLSYTTFKVKISIPELKVSHSNHWGCRYHCSFNILPKS